MSAAGIQGKLSTRSMAIALALLVGAFLFSPFQPGRQATVPSISQAVSRYLAAHPGQPVPVIVTAKQNAVPLENAVRASGGTVGSQFADVNSFSATVPSAVAQELNHDARVKGMTVNAAIRWEGSVNYTSLLNRYNSFSRVPSIAWNGKLLDGSGVQVAVIDSGVWPHDDLVLNSPAVPANTGNRLVSLYTNPLATDALDHVGHGTHVAGILAGNGYDSNGQYIGVAPNALVVGVKISDNLGNANEGDVISGLEWVYQANQHGMHIRVINLSLASTVPQSYNQSALDAMVEKLWFSGVVVVASAGNGNGPVQFAPGNDPYAITVGSIEDHYQTDLTQTEVAPWSLTGTTQDGFNKPEVVADGSHVISLLAPGSSLSLQHTANIVGTSYFKMGGTSMAAPQVAGMAALMLQANPNLTPNKVKSMLRHGSQPFSTIAFTSWLGTPGGFLDASSIGRVLDADDNGGVATSQSFNPLTGTILAGGTGWADANWATASWNGTAWNGTAWNGTAWNGTAWNGVGTSAPTLTSLVWDPTSWANTQWVGTAWNGTAWNGTAWNTIQWATVSWDGTAWNGTAWNGTAWNGTAWNSTQFVGTAWNGTAWNGTAWNGTAWNGTAWNGTAWNSTTWDSAYFG